MYHNVPIYNARDDTRVTEIKIGEINSVSATTDFVIIYEICVHKAKRIHNLEQKTIQ